MDENSLCLHKDAHCTNKETISKYQKNGSDRVGISTEYCPGQVVRQPGWQLVLLVSGLPDTQ